MPTPKVEVPLVVTTCWEMWKSGVPIGSLKAITGICLIEALKGLNRRAKVDFGWFVGVGVFGQLLTSL
jgi:hypothetical protein